MITHSNTWQQKFEDSRQKSNYSLQYLQDKEYNTLNKVDLSILPDFYIV